MLKEYRSVTQDEIELGQTFTKSKKITKQDVENFAVTTGDMNPAHMDDQYAQQSIFKTRIAHGMLGAGLISACLGMNLPGPGTIYLGQTLKFVHPIYFNDEITAKVEVVNLIDKKKFIMAELYTTVANQDGDLLIEGTATVIPPKGE